MKNRFSRPGLESFDFHAILCLKLGWFRFSNSDLSSGSDQKGRLKLAGNFDKLHAYFFDNSGYRGLHQ